jgi:hypothetical protein
VLRNRALMERNFAQLSDGKGQLLFEDSASDYLFYATGRVHCRSLTATLDVRSFQAAMLAPDGHTRAAG